MASLIERIKNVFTDQMYEPDVARKWVNSAVEDARTYMAQGLIGFAHGAGEFSKLTDAAVDLGANREKLENGLRAIAEFDRSLATESQSPDWLVKEIRQTTDKMIAQIKEDNIREAKIQEAVEQEIETGITPEQADRLVEQEIDRYYELREREENEILPEDLGLTPDQATLLCCIRNVQSAGQTVTGERLYCEMRAAGIGERGDMDGVYGHLKTLQDKGMITTKTNSYGVEVSITEDGRTVANNDVDRRKEELLADLSDRKAELQQEFDRVRSWTDDNGNVVTLSPEGFAEYLEALCLVDQMELAVKNSAPLRLTGQIPEDTAANQVLDDFREQLAQVGSKIERVMEQKESARQDQAQELEPVMAMKTGMRMAV